jgi:DNA-directed RNA polymerase specialized sigma24 family protein
MIIPKDQFYIDKVLVGDSSAFAVLVDRHKNIVFNICVKILGNREEAEEVAQDGG